MAQNLSVSKCSHIKSLEGTLIVSFIAFLVFEKLQPKDHPGRIEEPVFLESSITMFKKIEIDSEIDISIEIEIENDINFPIYHTIFKILLSDLCFL